MRCFVLMLCVLWPAVVTAEIATLLPVSVTCSQSAGQRQTLHDRQELRARWSEVYEAFRDREDALERLVNMQIAQYRHGRVHFQAVYESLRQLREAQYEGARVFGTEEQRQEVLQQSQELAKESLQLADARFRAGGVTEFDLAYARALMAEARIAILRDRMTGGGAFPRVPAEVYPKKDPSLPDVPSDAPSDQEAPGKGKDPPDES